MTDGRITKEDIQSISVNADVAKSVLAQAEKMHGDLIDDKKSLESKASSLFGSYVTLATAFFGAGGYLVKDTSTNISPYPLFFMGCGFALACLMLVRVQQSDQYGISGSDPRSWLQSGWLDARSDVTAKFNAYLIMQYIKKIDASIEANKRKRNNLKAGMYTAAGSLLLGVFAIAIFSWFPSGQSLLQWLH